MTMRPRTAPHPPPRGGDGPRRLWSEAPVRRPELRRVPAAQTVCAGYNLTRASLTPSTATFVPGQPAGFTALRLDVDANLATAGPVGFRARVDDAEWTGWTQATGPGPVTVLLYPRPNDIQAAVHVEWDTPGAVTSVCADTVNEE